MDSLINKFEKAGTEIYDQTSNIGKFYGITTNIFIIILCIVIIIFSIKLIINNSKYIKTVGIVVKVQDQCDEYPVYDQKNNKIGTNINCKTIIKYKLKTINSNAVQMKQYSLPFSYNNLNDNKKDIKLGYNSDDQFYYQEFILKRKYNINDNIEIFYFDNDPFNTATISYFPTFIGWIGIIVSVFIICNRIIQIILLSKFKIISSAAGVGLAKNMIFG